VSRLERVQRAASRNAGSGGNRSSSSDWEDKPKKYVYSKGWSKKKKTYIAGEKMNTDSDR